VAVAFRGLRERRPRFGVEDLVRFFLVDLDPEYTHGGYEVMHVAALGLSALFFSAKDVRILVASTRTER